MTKLELMVSVVIPTYNRADSIARAIHSVIEQTHQNLEIIVVDDASQDDTSTVVNNIRDPRIRYYRHQTNQGGSAARNTGIKASEGKLIAFLDSDDIWLPDKLELQLQAIADSASDPENVVSYTKFRLTTTAVLRPSILPLRGKQPHETLADYLWLGRGEMLASTLIVSRSLALANLWRSDLPKHQDLDFVLRLGQQGAEFIFVDRPLTIWHNEERGDRVSRLNGYQPSLDWIESYRERISQRAFQGFVLKEIVPKMLLNDDTKLQGIKLLIRGWRDRIIPFDYFLFSLAKQVLLRSYQIRLKKLINRFRRTKIDTFG